MPGRDGTGPMGYGPRSRGGFGWCPPVADPRMSPPVYGVGRGGIPRGGGRGLAWGGGMGWRRSAPYAQGFPGRYYRGPVRDAGQADEAGFLRERIQDLEEELKTAKDRLRDVESPAGKAS